jgi:purine-binding chemotaxis protein CheW
MTPDDLSRSNDAALPDWLTGVGDGPALALPDLADLAGPETEQLTLTPPPAPTGQWQVAALEVTRDRAAGKDFHTFHFRVHNPSRSEYREYKAEFALPPGASAAVTREAARTRRGLEWNLGVLPPGGAVELGVRLRNGDRTAYFRTRPAAIQVAHRALPEARLDVSADLPGVVLANRPAVATVAVSAVGAHAPADVRLDLFDNDPHAPFFTETLRGVPPGETRLVIVPLHPKCGLARFRAVATAAGATTAQATFETLGAEPEAGVKLILPPTVGTDEEIAGRLVVTNRTLLPVGGFRASVAVPDELAFRGATQRGVLSEKGDRVEWSVGELAAGAEWSAELRLVGFSPGRMRLLAAVAADGLPEVTASAPLTCEVRRTADGATLAELLAGLTVPVFDDLAEAPALVPRDARTRHLLFRAAGVRFALPIGNVREILKPLPVTAVPGTPDWMCGVANVRGDIVTVIDLAPFLGLGEAGPRRGLLVVRADGADPLGVLIDEVAGIHPLAAGDVPAVADAELTRFLAGVTPDPAGLIHRLDPAELLAAAQT